jgi:hypothetical protein
MPPALKDSIEISVRDMKKDGFAQILHSWKFPVPVWLLFSYLQVQESE